MWVQEIDIIYIVCDLLVVKFKWSFGRLCQTLEFLLINGNRTHAFSSSVSSNELDHIMIKMIGNIIEMRFQRLGIIKRWICINAPSSFSHHIWNIIPSAWVGSKCTLSSHMLIPCLILDGLKQYPYVMTCSSSSALLSAMKEK